MTEYQVEFVNRDEEITVSDTETILNAAIDSGFSQEYSCRVGMCLACVAEIKEGEVEQPASRALTEEQQEDYALTCMARPQSGLRLETGSYPGSDAHSPEGESDFWEEELE